MDQPQDLSPSAIRRVVLAQSVQHPAVVYPAALGVLGGLGAAVVAGAPTLLVGGAVVAGVAAAAAFAANYFGRYDRVAGDYLKDLREGMAKERLARIDDLAEDLRAVGAPEAERQLARLMEKMNAFQEVLGERLSPSELTYARFSAIAESVFLAGIENLRSIHLSLRTLAGIDEAYIASRLGQIGGRNQSDAGGNESVGLRHQLQQAEVLRARVKERLGQNELAMAEIDRATSAVGEMKTGSDRPSMDMEAAMQELARIAKRSADY